MITSYRLPHWLIPTEISTYLTVHNASNTLKHIYIVRFYYSGKYSHTKTGINVLKISESPYMINMPCEFNLISCKLK